jgi:hypothetical protein
MPISPPGHLPGDPDAPQHDYLGLAVASVAFGILLGTGVITAALWGVRMLQAGTAATATPDPAGPAAILLLAGTLGGVGAGAAAAWTLMWPVGSLYRRGGLAMVSGFASLVFALIAMPLDGLFGRAGLLGYAGLCALGCLLIARRGVGRRRQS